MATTQTKYYASNHSRAQARKLGVIIAPSYQASAKLDVYKNGYHIATIGKKGEHEYATVLQQEKQGLAPKGTADHMRQQRHNRFKNARQGTNLWWALQILW